VIGSEVMRPRPSRRKRQLVAVGIALSLAGCSTMQPYQAPRVDDIRPGPGLFTGEKGAFYLVGGDDSSPKDEAK
jgi:hypothetical protein